MLSAELKAEVANTLLDLHNSSCEPHSLLVKYKILTGN